MFKRPLHNIGVIEAASGCNLRCPSCVSWTEKGKDLVTPEITKKALKHFKDLDIKQVQLYWRGDPCIHPRLPEIASIVKAEGLITIISTNGCTKYCGDKDYMSALLPNIDHYAVCLDGWNPDNIHKYRVGAKWETMMHNLEIMASIDAPNCDKILSVLMFKHNEGKEQFFLDIAAKHGMRVDFKAPDVLGHYILTEELANEWLSMDPITNSRYDKYHVSQLPKQLEWRGSMIETESLGEYVYVHRSGEKCEEGNLIVAADGTIPYCGQFTNKTDGLGTVDDTIGDILTKYIGINNDMYHRKLAECGNKCLCIFKQRG
jgi:MoaA/NifB/PqqE/SkfB family radical SAM enzyme